MVQVLHYTTYNTERVPLLYGFNVAQYTFHVYDV